MKIQIKEWVNSQKTRLPKSILLEVGIQLNNTLNADVDKEKIILSRSFCHKTLEERIRESGCELSGIGEVNWGDPKGNEVW